MIYNEKKRKLLFHNRLKRMYYEKKIILFVTRAFIIFRLPLFPLFIKNTSISRYLQKTYNSSSYI